MDMPVYLRPKMRCLAQCLRKCKKFPKSIYPILDRDMFKIEDKALQFIPIAECCENLAIFTEIKNTSELGLGVFAQQDLAANEYIGCYLGTIEEHPKIHLTANYKEIAYNFACPFSEYCVNALKKGNATSLLNHSDNPNLVGCEIVHESEVHTAFFTKYAINKGEQLFIDYGEEYWETAECFGVFRK